MRMEKNTALRKALIALVLVFIFWTGYSAPRFFFGKSDAEKTITHIIDSKTGLPLSQAAVDAIASEQEFQSVTHTLIGQVTVKLRDSLQVQVKLKDNSYLIQVKFAPNMVFLKNMPLPSNPKVSEEQEVSFADVNVGDTVTLTFPQGLLLRDIAETKTVIVPIITIDMPHQPNFAED